VSRIGKAPVEVPTSVNVEIEISGRSVKVMGPKGELTVPIGHGVEVTQEDGSLVLTRASEAPEHKAMHGLTRSLIQNAVTGVTEGFSKTLQIAGVGYRAQLQGRNINLQVGFSHPVAVSPREGVEFEVPNATTIIVRGIDKQRVHREKRRKRVRRKIIGTAERPRLSVYRSNVHIYAQLIDDYAGHTLAAADSREVGEAENRTEAARRVGELVARRAADAGIQAVVFDRGGSKYHGRVAALAEGARVGGLRL
jgi:large subunit ribosomal protein L6